MVLIAGCRDHPGEQGIDLMNPGSVLVKAGELIPMTVADTVYG